MIDLLHLHFEASGSLVDQHFGIDPNPDPNPRFHLFPNLAVREFVDIAVVQAIEVVDYVALDYTRCRCGR
jgi:hypothetical protein